VPSYAALAGRAAVFVPALVVTIGDYGPPWLQAAATTLTGVAVGIAVAAPAALGFWRSIGYDEGRASFMFSLDEAIRRGMPPSEWLRAELERELGGTIRGLDE
jgi:hypothetical protein